MNTPLDNISDGYRFQQIVAEYFRWLKDKEHNFSISDIDVHESGVGGDDGCDILIEFHFEDAIIKHSQKWIVECKSQGRAIGPKKINTSNIVTLLDSKDAIGYLLVCKNDATASLKRIFSDFNAKNKRKYIVWNGFQLWNMIIKSERLLKATFPEHHEKYYINKMKDFDKIITDLSEQLKPNQ